MEGKETNNSKAKMLWKSLPLKIKLIIVGITVGFFFLIIFLIVLIAPLISLGIIDIGMGGGDGETSLSYSDINGSTSYWWPIGSSKTEKKDGKEFATGDPVSTTITSYFGTRKDPFTGETSSHSGVDIASGRTIGTVNIIAAKDGTVIYPTTSDVTNCRSNSDLDSCGGGYGNYVMIEHSDGTRTLYGHMYENSITVKSGDVVKQGQVIGKMGSSGRSTGTHLHFEVRVNGNQVEPLNYVSEDNPRPVSKTGTVVKGNSNKQTVCLTLINSEYSLNGAIALFTNIDSESNHNFDPTVLGDYNNGVPTSYGLCQWHNGRWDNLKNTFPNTYDTIGGQLDFLRYELKNGYKELYDDLINSKKSAASLTKEFCKKFERPANAESTCTYRANNSKNLADYVKNGCK